MKVIVTIEAPIVQYPSGTTTTGTVFSLTTTASGTPIPSQTVAPGVLAVEFDNVADGAYTATAQLLDGAGAALGALATSALFEVVTPTVGIATPASVTVVVS